jgi:hypothetical protein
MAPERRDLRLACAILELFERYSSLGCNVNKCQLTPIRCNQEQVALATSLFPGQLVEFLIKYLAIPLSATKLPR